MDIPAWVDRLAAAGPVAVEAGRVVPRAVDLAALVVEAGASVEAAPDRVGKAYANQGIP